MRYQFAQHANAQTGHIPEERYDTDQGADDEYVKGDRSETDEEARGQVDRRVEQDGGAKVEPKVRHRNGHRRGHRASNSGWRRLCSL